MQIGVLGLGKMGGQIARRLKRKGFEVWAWNRSPKPREEFRKTGGKAADGIAELISRLKPPRVLWLMLPAGEATQKILNELVPHLSRNDIVVDGSNSFYAEASRRAKKLRTKGIAFLDCGTSGGVWGEKYGFSLMIGGDKKVFKKVETVFKALAAGNGRGYGLVGSTGAGHFAKMVHNGIEYGMMEALAEGFALVHQWNPKLDLAQIARIWQNGSVVRSWLLDLALDIFEKENLKQYKGFVRHTGEGEWTVKVGEKLGADVRVIKAALKVRRESARKTNQKLLRNKILALLRNRFGGHEARKI